MKIGSTLVIDGRFCEVMLIAPSGDVQVRDVITLELRWTDYFVHRFIDPNKNPEALLDAMSTIRTDDDPPP